MGEKLTEELGEESFRKFTFDTIHEFEGKDYRKEREKVGNFFSIGHIRNNCLHSRSFRPSIQ